MSAQQHPPAPQPQALQITPNTDHTCLFGVSSNGSCSGADALRGLAPAGLLILGALALLGSGAFVEALRSAMQR